MSKCATGLFCVHKCWLLLLKVTKILKCKVYHKLKHCHTFANICLQIKMWKKMKISVYCPHFCLFLKCCLRSHCRPCKCWEPRHRQYCRCSTVLQALNPKTQKRCSQNRGGQIKNIYMYYIWLQKSGILWGEGVYKRVSALLHFVSLLLTSTLCYIYKERAYSVTGIILSMVVENT